MMFFAVIFSLVSLCCRQGGGSEMVKVKIVEAPAVLKGINTHFRQHYITQEKVLTPRVDPIPFAGPPHLAVLSGKCFSLVDKGYQYELCPFYNVTQREQTSRWNAFHGILGVWQGWEIVNNTFTSMLMAEGDYCPNNVARKTNVFMKCAKSHLVVSVSEPATCHYEMIFNTPLACPEDAMLVFPALSSKGKSKWLDIEEELWREEVTLQGYNKRRLKLFASQGFIAPEESHSEATDEVETAVKGVMEGTRSVEKKEFLTKDQCNKAYEELLAEVSRLRKLVNPFKKNNKSEGINENKHTQEATKTPLIETQTNETSNQYKEMKRQEKGERKNDTKPAHDREREEQLRASKSEKLKKYFKGIKEKIDSEHYGPRKLDEGTIEGTKTFLRNNTNKQDKKRPDESQPGSKHGDPKIEAEMYERILNSKHTQKLHTKSKQNNEAHKAGENEDEL